MTAIDWPERIRRGLWGEDLALRRHRYPVGPRNTWSNLSFALAAVWVALSQVGDVRLVFAVALLLLAIGSAGYHAFKTTFWNNVDWAGMGAKMSVLVVNGIARNAEGLALGAFTVGVVAAMLIAQHMHFDKVMGGLAIAALIPTYLNGDALLATVSLVCYALALLAWHADKKGWRIIGLYGHAAWHCLAAAGGALLFAAQQG